MHGRLSLTLGCCSVPNIVLPIGISFYTFQTISYTVDCYWGKVKPQKNFGRFLLYVSMFPQLVAGPIVRYSVIGEEINERKTTAKDISDGFSRIILGLGKKVIIANNLSTIVTALFGSASNGYENIKTLSVAGTWLGAILVGLWYYFDFSGYSDIAIGLGRIFGFHFDENFKYPFICKTISECALSPYLRQKKKIRRTFPCMVLHRTLARRKLELCFLGTLLWNVHIL